MKVLVIEPTWNKVVGSTGKGSSMLVTPKPAVCTESSGKANPTAAPGTPKLAIVALRSFSGWS